MTSFSSFFKNFQKHLNGDYYPIIGIPDYIRFTLSESPSFPKPQKPSLPIKPTLELPPPPHPPIQGKFSKAIGFNMIYQSNMLEYYSRLNKYHKLHEPARTAHAEKMMLYDIELKRYKSEELPLYDRIFKLQKKLNAFLPVTPTDRASRAKIISAYLEIVPRPINGIDDDSEDVYNDIAESFFEKYLIDKYGISSVLRYHTIGHSEYAYNEYCTVLPDFILTIPKTNLVIAIEIDEPYSTQIFSPKHYLKEESFQENGWPDYPQEFMDSILNECGWAVIRFTERQIVEHTMDCIDLIGSLANYLLQKSDANDIIRYMQKIIPEKRWSEDDAHVMSFKKYRQSYLPDELLTKRLWTVSP